MKNRLNTSLCKSLVFVGEQLNNEHNHGDDNDIICMSAG